MLGNKFQLTTEVFRGNPEGCLDCLIGSINSVSTAGLFGDTGRTLFCAEGVPRTGDVLGDVERSVGAWLGEDVLFMRGTAFDRMADLEPSGERVSVGDINLDWRVNDFLFAGTGGLGPVRAFERC